VSVSVSVSVSVTPAAQVQLESQQTQYACVLLGNRMSTAAAVRDWQYLCGSQ